MKTLVTRRQAFAATYSLTLAPFTAGAAEREKVGMQLILAADVSGSVNATRYKTQQDGYLEALGDPHVLDVIGGAADDDWDGGLGDVVDDEREAAQDVAPPVALEIRKEWAETLEHRGLR